MDLFVRSVNRWTWPDSNRRPLPAKHALSLVSYTALRQNSMRTENSADPLRDDCPIQVIPSSPSAKILSRGNLRICVTTDGGIRTFSYSGNFDYEFDASIRSALPFGMLLRISHVSVLG